MNSMKLETYLFLFHLFQEFNAKVDAEQEGEDDDEGEGESPEKQDKHKPVFNEKEFLERWDEENPEIQVPDEVVEDQDNDFNVEIIEQQE